LALLLTVIGCGVALRAWNLAYPTLFVDEAESAVNALSILENGFPSDHYLGLPLFENSLIKPWPGNPEYEFREINYSNQGVAVYHSWLPLYAIAASFTLQGIQPDIPQDPPRVRHSPREIRRRIVAARLPGVIVSAVYLVAVYLAGRALAGLDTAWLTLVVTAFAEPIMREGRQARYYSMTLALTMLCLLAIWQMYVRGRRRDFAFGAVALTLLFYTHLLSFVVAIASWCLCATRMIRRPLGFRRSLALGGFLVLGTLPWVVLTGFLGHAASLPKGRPFLVFPDDYLLYFRMDTKPCLVVGVCTGFLVLIHLGRRWLPGSLTRPFLALGAAPFFLIGWMAISLLAFLWLMPAPSLFFWRIRLLLEGPAILLVAMMVAATARAVTPRLSAWVTIAVLLFVLGYSTRKATWLAPPPEPTDSALQMTEDLRQLDLKPGTRVYAAPNYHLILSFYTGMPVQSIAPIRKSFLNNYPGEILIIDAVAIPMSLSRSQIRQAAARAGKRLSDSEISQWYLRLSSRVQREELSQAVAEVVPPLEEIPPYLEALVRFLRQLQLDQHTEDKETYWGNPAIFRGFTIRDPVSYWQVLFYRFVDPLSRSGANANYVERLRRARAVVFPSGWLMYECRPPGKEAQ
jgi:hypothetical protein